MAGKSDKRPPRTSKEKVGSSRSAAEHFAGERDFGIAAEQTGRSIDMADGSKMQSGLSRDDTAHGPAGRANLMSADIDDDAAAGEISQGEAAGDDNTDVDNLS